MTKAEQIRQHYHAEKEFLVAAYIGGAMETWTMFAKVGEAKAIAQRELRKLKRGGYIVTVAAIEP
jgi:hypothetical protein